MLKNKMCFITVITAVFLIFFVGAGLTATLVSKGGTASMKPSPSSTGMLKVTYFVKKIQNNVLYLENNQRYNLNNVKLTILPGSGNIGTGKKRRAEMVFINNVLKEVTIR